ncbi:MAG: phage tail protein [Bacteroidota bacterium]
MAYPLPTYSYRVIIAGYAMAFHEVSGLTVQHDEIVYRDGMSWYYDYSISRGFAKPINLTLRSGVVLPEPGEVPATAEQLKVGFFLGDKPLDIEIQLTDGDGTVLLRWKVIGAVPMKVELPGLRADSNEIAIQSMDLTARTLKILT